MKDSNQQQHDSNHISNSNENLNQTQRKQNSQSSHEQTQNDFQILDAQERGSSRPQRFTALAQQEKENSSLTGAEARAILDDEGITDKWIAQELKRVATQAMIANPKT